LYIIVVGVRLSPSYGCKKIKKNTFIIYPEVGKLLLYVDWIIRDGGVCDRIQNPTRARLSSSSDDDVEDDDDIIIIYCNGEKKRNIYIDTNVRLYTDAITETASSDFPPTFSSTHYYYLLIFFFRSILTGRIILVVTDCIASTRIYIYVYSV